MIEACKHWPVDSLYICTCRQRRRHTLTNFLGLVDSFEEYRLTCKTCGNGLVIYYQRYIELTSFSNAIFTYARQPWKLFRYVPEDLDERLQMSLTVIPNFLPCLICFLCTLSRCCSRLFLVFRRHLAKKKNLQRKPGHNSVCVFWRKCLLFMCETTQVMYRK